MLLHEEAGAEAWHRAWSEWSLLGHRGMEWGDIGAIAGTGLGSVSLVWQWWTRRQSRKPQLQASVRSGLYSAGHEAYYTLWLSLSNGIGRPRVYVNDVKLCANLPEGTTLESSGRVGPLREGAKVKATRMGLPFDSFYTPDDPFEPGQERQYYLPPSEAAFCEGLAKLPAGSLCVEIRGGGGLLHSMDGAQLLPHVRTIAASLRERRTTAQAKGDQDQ